MGPLSVDLRKRVVSAVREEGMSCRAAAQRFGVSFSKRPMIPVAALRERGRLRAVARWPRTRISCFAFSSAYMTLC